MEDEAKEPDLAVCRKRSIYSYVCQDSNELGIDREGGSCVEYEGDAELHDWVPPWQQRGEKAEGLMRELFRLHDLNGNGFLEEVELVKLNEKISILHCGPETDRGAVRERYKSIFRDRLNPDGTPAPYARFREYMFQILDGLDPDEPTQVMIIQQLIAEADLALATFPASLKIRCGSLAMLPMKQPASDNVSPQIHRPVCLGGG